MRIDDPRIIVGPEPGQGYIEDGYEINFNSGGTALIFKGLNSNGNPSIQPFSGLIDIAGLQAAVTNQNVANGFGNGYLTYTNFTIDTINSPPNETLINYPINNLDRWNPFYTPINTDVQVYTSINNTAHYTPLSCFFYTKGVNKTGTIYIHFIWKLRFDNGSGGSFTDGNWSIPFKMDGSPAFGLDPTTTYWPYTVEVGANYLDVSSTGLTGQWGVSIDADTLSNGDPLAELSPPPDGFLNFSTPGWTAISRAPFNVTVRGIMKAINFTYSNFDDSLLYYNPSDFRSYGGTGTAVANISLSGGLSGTLVGTAPYFSYEKYGSFTFNGTNDRLDIGNSFNYQSFGISMWVKPGASQVSFANIIDNNHNDTQNWVLQQNNTTTNQYVFTCRLVGGSSRSVTFPTMTANTWYHIAVTFDPFVTCKGYINGELIGSDTPASGININYLSPYCQIGAWRNAGTPTRYFNGSVGVVKFWNSYRSDDQMRNEFQAYRDQYGI